MSDTSFAGPESPTTVWQKLDRPWAVLPVGATEQHGPHLPVNTDVLEAEYFARGLARELGAGLLPVVPILHSFEQTGFRGSLSLGLETGIAVIRDIAEQLEGQGFTRLVILNFHGGNHILKPVAKDINRRDRRLRVILLNGWEYDSSDEGRLLGRGEVHAGAWETSLMLAIRPDLVGDYAAAEAPAGIAEAVQDDLAHLGLGVLRPAGPWGDPRGANAETGKIILASIAANLAKAARQRLGWLDENPSYSGGGRVVIRTQRPWDIPAGLELCRIAGWNQKEADWRLFQELSPEGCFAAVENGRIEGTAAAVPGSGGPGWIALMLVRPGMRKRGIGTLLFRRALDALAEEPCVKLLATPEGYGLYKLHGFKAEGTWALMVRPAGPFASPAGNTTPRAAPMTESDLAETAALDLETGLPSGDRLLRRLLAMAPAHAAAARDRSGGLAGFLLGRPGENYETLGPLAARSMETAETLVRAFLSGRDERPAGILVPRDPEWTAILEALGFEERRELILMYRGENLYPSGKGRYALAGPDLGY